MKRLRLGIYRHFKGKKYRVLFLAKCSETKREMVVYRGLYGAREIFVRPLEKFLENVEIISGTEEKRFAYLYKGERLDGNLNVRQISKFRLQLQGILSSKNWQEFCRHSLENEEDEELYRAFMTVKKVIEKCRSLEEVIKKANEYKVEEDNLIEAQAIQSLVVVAKNLSQPI